MATRDQEMNQPHEEEVSYPETPMSEETHGSPYAEKRISWGAIFAGGFVALVVLTTLNLLGIGVGAAAVDPAAEAQPFQGLGIVAGIWWTVSFLIALFAGGFVAGRLSGATDRYESVIHGLVTWGLVTMVSLFFVMTAAGQIVGGAMGMVGQGLTAATDIPQVTQAMEAQLQEAGMTAEEAQAALAQIGEDVASGIAAAAFWAFVALLLGGLLAAVGSTLGAFSIVKDRAGVRTRRREYVPGRVRHA